MPEDLHRGTGVDEAVPAKRTKLANGLTVPRDREGSTLIESAHDAAAVVPQLSLTDALAHGGTVALGATARATCARRGMNPAATETDKRALSHQQNSAGE
jgi:hypothetical protein